MNPVNFHHALLVRIETMEGTDGGKAVQSPFLQLVMRVGQDLVHPGATLYTSPDISAHQEPPNLSPSLSLSQGVSEFLVHPSPSHNRTSKQSFDLIDLIHNPHAFLCYAFIQVCESTFIIL